MTQKLFPLRGSGLVKPFIIKQLCSLFLNNTDNRNYTNEPDQKFTYPGNFGLITCTHEVDTNVICDLPACNKSVCLFLSYHSCSLKMTKKS